MTETASTQRHPLSGWRWVGAVVAVLAVVLLTAGGPLQVLAEPPADSGTLTGPAVAVPRAVPGQRGDAERTAATVTPDARVGRPARSTRIHFEPTQLTLGDEGHAAVQPASTVDGELRVPEDVRHLGWWDGSADAGDPFGATVIAGHVDSKTQGLGFFARLLKVRKGDVVVLRGDGHEARYRVVSVRSVKKAVLSDGTKAFDQTQPHRLSLITCTGAYRVDRGGYDSNLLVTAEPIGFAR